MILLWLILLPIVAAIVVAFGPTRHARPIALFTTLAALLGGAYALFTFDYGNSADFQFAVQVPWLKQLGVTLSVGADAVSLFLIALTVLLGPICVLASTTAITTRERTYYAWFLVLQGAVTGVFAARDLVFFYVCFEFTLIPMFILISLFGSTNRKKAAIKFFLYTFTGSIITLAGLAYVAWRHVDLGHALTFDIKTLEATSAALPAAVQGWVMLALLLGFAVKVPLFPFHTWLPLAHTEAPTVGSVVLAGVLLKLGTYGIFRFVLPFTPLAVQEHAPLLAAACIVGILYGGLICWVQTDVKKLVAYSSVAHLGFCMLGLFAMNNIGLQGSVLYMINHGLSTGALFLLIGMIYERYHTRSMKELGGLAAKMPVWATFMVFFTMASVGLPGLNGFVSEFFCLQGAFSASSAWGSGEWGSLGAAIPGATLGSLGPWYAAIAGVGMIVAAMYLLLMLGKVVWGKLLEPHTQHGTDHHDEPALPADLTRREIGLLIPLAVLCVVLGLYPSLITDPLEAPITQTVKALGQARNAALAQGTSTDAPASRSSTNDAPVARDSSTPLASLAEELHP